MSMRESTAVDVGGGRVGPSLTLNLPPRRGLPAMTPIAAYYVMINTDLERESKKQHYAVVVPRESLLARIVNALETLVRLGRPATTQPI
jgi:hypothetical protein